jgi:hypothetical protein
MNPDLPNEHVPKMPFAPQLLTRPWTIALPSGTQLLPILIENPRLERSLVADLTVQRLCDSGTMVIILVFDIKTVVLSIYFPALDGWTTCFILWSLRLR